MYYIWYYYCIAIYILYCILHAKSFCISNQMAHALVFVTFTAIYCNTFVTGRNLHTMTRQWKDVAGRRQADCFCYQYCKTIHAYWFATQLLSLVHFCCCNVKPLEYFRSYDMFTFVSTQWNETVTSSILPVLISSSGWIRAVMWLRQWEWFISRMQPLLLWYLLIFSESSVFVWIIFPSQITTVWYSKNSISNCIWRNYKFSWLLLSLALNYSLLLFILKLLF